MTFRGGCRTRMGRVALHSCNTTITCIKPANPAYPTTIKTLGDHLRKTRLDRRMSQAEVAAILMVSNDTVNGWELNRHRPTAKMAKKIVEFLDYMPFDLATDSLADRLYHARMVSGFTQSQIALKLNCDVSNLRYIELGRRRPHEPLHVKILEFIRNTV